MRLTATVVVGSVVMVDDDVFTVVLVVAAVLVGAIEVLGAEEVGEGDVDEVVLAGDELVVDAWPVVVDDSFSSVVVVC